MPIAVLPLGFATLCLMKQPVLFQRTESAAIFAAAVYFYFHLGFALIWFIVFLFSFDIFMVGYFSNSKTGALLYNFGHSYLMPALLLIVGSVTSSRFLVAFGLIWAAHIGFDRALGYGLKFSDGFTHTHLGTIGKK